MFRLLLTGETTDPLPSRVKCKKKLATFGGSNRNSQPGRFGKATTFGMLSTRGGIFGRASGKNYLCRPIFCKRRMSSKWGDVGLPPRKYIRMWKIAKSEIARIMRGFTLEISQEVYKKCDLASGAPGHRCTTSKMIFGLAFSMDHSPRERHRFYEEFGMMNSSS